MSVPDDGTTGADKALSQLSLNPSPSVDDLLAAAASNVKLSPKSGGDAKAENATDGATSEAPPSSAAATTRLRVRIKRYHAVARWTWNVAGVSPGDNGDDGSTASRAAQQRMSVDFPPDEEEEVCTICQSAFEGTAPGSKFPGDECPVVWGKCGHSFHLSCVSTWLGDKTTCPYCRAEWEFGLDEPVEEDDDEDGEEDLGEGNTSAERSGNTIRRRQIPALPDSSDDDSDSDDDVDDQHDSAGDSQEDVEEEDDFWDSESDSEEEEEEEEESFNNADSENDASRSPSPFRGAGGGSESYDSDGDVGGSGRSYRYATP